MQSHLRVQPIIAGEVNSVLRLGKAGMRGSARWTQYDSDIVAQFLQVSQQIKQSKWCKSRCHYTMESGTCTSCELPAFEDFVFAAVYFRQLIANDDHLFRDAVDRYCAFVDCEGRKAWVQEELACFENDLKQDAEEMAGITTKDLFEAFLYGAALMHKPNPVGNAKRETFLRFYDNQSRQKLLFSLHSSLRQLLNHVGGVAIVIHRDYSHWQLDYSLPLPDVRWHDRLFDTPYASPPDSAIQKTKQPS